MSEKVITRAAIKLFKRKEEIQELKDRKAGLDEPEKPDSAVSYNEASKIGYRLSKYKTKIKNLDGQISNLRSEVSKLEKEIKNHIPAANIPIKISGKYDNSEINLIVEVDDQEKVVEVKQQE